MAVSENGVYPPNHHFNGVIIVHWRVFPKFSDKPAWRKTIWRKTIGKNQCLPCRTCGFYEWGFEHGLFDYVLPLKWRFLTWKQK
jgi:hypothetical protein